MYAHMVQGYALMYTHVRLRNQLYICVYTWMHALFMAMRMHVCMYIVTDALCQATYAYMHRCRHPVLGTMYCAGMRACLAA